MLVLLLDFGASRIKAAVAETTPHQIVAVKSYAAATPRFSEGRKCEIQLAEIKAVLQNVLADFNDFAFEGIFISSEMHGFIVADENNTPLTNYISWKDERCLMSNGKETFYETVLHQSGQDFRTVTGMTARPCFPLFNFFALQKTTPFNRPVKILTLPDFLAQTFGQNQNKTHITMAAGLGFYDIVNKKYDDRFIDMCGKNITFNEVVSNVCPAAFYTKNEKFLPVYTGVGDHQCAVYGAGNTEKTISFNLGTGSQISVVSDKTKTQTDLRPFFNGQSLHTVTHIPSGRALQEYVGFLGSDAWEELDALSASDMTASTLDFDLAVFESAANFKGYKGIGQITEKSLTRQNWLASLLRSYADQYIDILRRFDVDNNRTVILSGGISRRIPALKDYFKTLLPYRIEVADITEETFFGLLNLACSRKEGGDL